MVELPPAHRLKVFMSYSRRDLAIADRLVAALEESGVEVLIDRRDLPYGEEWQKELADFLRASDTVIWLVSPDSITSKWVNWELGEVGRLSKRLIPVRVREVDPTSLPDALGKIHLLPAEGAFDFGRHLAPLVETLNTDRAWLKEATRLADRARQWIAKDRDKNLLLRGRSIGDAEAWSRAKPQAMPPVGSEILELILNSHRAAVRRQRQFTAAALAIAVVGFGLALFSWQQRNAALVNQSTYLAKLSRDNLGAGDAGTSLLLAISALPKWPLALDRPYVPEAGRSLNDAALALREATVLAGHTDDVNTVRFSSDDRYVLTSSDDKTAKLWDAGTGAVLNSFEPHPGKVFRAELSPDDKLVATVTDDDNIYLWDAGNGDIVHTLTGHTDLVTSITFLDAATLMSASRDGTVRIWDLGGSKLSKVLQVSGASVNAVVASPDGKSLLTSSEDGIAALWDRTSLQLRKRLEDHAAPVLGGVFDMAGIRIATFSADQTVRIWDAGTGRLVASVPQQGSAITSQAFCASGECLVTAAADGSAKLLDTATGNLLFQLNGHSQSITRAGVSPGGKFAATVSRDGLGLLWEVATGKKLLTLGGHSSDIFDASFSHNGEFLVTASRDQTARIWRIPAPTTINSRINLSTSFRNIALSADDRLLALAGTDGSVQLLDRKSLRKLAIAKPLGDGAVTFVTFDSIGGRLLAGSENGTVTVLSVPAFLPIFNSSPDGTEIAGGGFDPSGAGFSVLTTAGAKFVFEEKGPVRRDAVASGGSDILVMTFSPALDRILVGRLDGKASIIDRSGERLLIGHRGAILAAAFDEGGQMLITGSEDGTARIWDAATGRGLQTLDGHGSPVVFVAVSADGNYFATASPMPDRAVRLWRLGSPEPLATYSGHLDGVDVVRFLHDRTGLVSASSDGDVHEWPFADDYSTMLNLARTLVPRCLAEAQLGQYGLQKAAAAWCEEELPVGGGGQKIP